MKSNKPYKSLKDVYSENVNGHVAPRKHLDVLGENWDDKPPATDPLLRPKQRLSGDPDETPELPLKGAEVESGKYAKPDHPKLVLDKKDLQDFEELDYLDQVKVKKYIQSKINNKNIYETFINQHDDEKDVAMAYRLLMSSDLTGDQIENVVQLVNKGDAIDADKLTAVGTKSPRDIFLHEDVWEVYKDIAPVGVGKAQKGPGEVALAFLSPRIELSTKGDIAIDGKLYELKLNGGRISDQAAPSQKQMQPILTKYLGESGRLAPGKKTMNLATFVGRVNEHKTANPDKDKDADYYSNLAREVFSLMLDEPHAESFARLFAADNVDPDAVMKEYKKQSFDWYKSTKVGGEGQWNKLIGINFASGKTPGIAVVETGDQFANTPMYAPGINILRSASGTREGYPDFYPQA